MKRVGLVRLLNQGIACLVALALAAPVLSQQQPAGGYTFRAESELVLVNVTARDKSGRLVRDLKQSDFTLLEDNKPQQVLSFDIENTDAVPTGEIVQPALTQTEPAESPKKTAAAPALSMKDRRLIVLFFDLTSMQPDEIDRAAVAAENYVTKQMSPADMVAVVSLGNTMTINQDFTSDRAKLQQVLQGFSLGAGQGFEEGSTGTTEGTADTGQAFTPDDTEYNIFNTDRRLEALRSLASQLTGVEQKKSLIYISSGMDRTGIENQSELRAAVNAAVRGNVSIYTMDIRGLQAIVPGGDATSASLRGTSPYSGKATLTAYDSNFTTQETLVTLAGDTGGKAFLDTNDFGKVFRGVQQDTSSYYILGYRSNNKSRDGKYRRITVRVNRPGLKLEFRRGYYAPTDFQHTNNQDREAQLDEELASDLPSTDVPVYLSAGYFRMADRRFYVPVSIAIPGSEIPFSRNTKQDRATLDVLGVVFDDSKRPVSRLRDTVKVAVDQSQEVRRKNVQYDGGFLLPPGKYHLKFVVRENQTGRVGSFETDLNIPDMKSVPLKMSSVVLSSQIQPAKHKADEPLVYGGSQIIPSVTHVFSSAQHMYIYYEVYEPDAKTEAARAPSNRGDVHLLSNLAFFQGNMKAFETPEVDVQELNAPGRKAVVFQLDVPLEQLKPGFYTCQVNVIDDIGGKFLFPRLALLVRQQSSNVPSADKKTAVQ